MQPLPLGMDSEQPADPVEEMAAKADVFGWGGRIAYATAFDRPELNAVLALWHEKGNGDIPLRTAFGARDFKSILPHLWMLEEAMRGTERRYRYRRVGTEIANVFGETTGKCIDEVIPPHLLPRWTEACAALLRCRAPVRVSTNVDLPRANYLSLESFHAPLLDAEHRPTILMCVTFFGRGRGGGL